MLVTLHLVVHCKSLAKIFSGPKGGVVHAVSGVSFDVAPGQVYGLLGVNGAGKTSVLRMLSTVLRPTSGHAEVAGYDVQTHQAEVRASIGFMSSSTALYGRLTAKETIQYFGSLFGITGRELNLRVDSLIERLGIGPFADRLCDKLSTGQKQRVSIARTLVHDPPVLFFDEPTSGLDVLTAQVVLEFIEEVKMQGKTIVYCTHILSEAERLCDRVGVIHGGTIRAEGTVPELKQASASESLEGAFLSLVGHMRQETLPNSPDLASKSEDGRH